MTFYIDSEFVGNFSHTPRIVSDQASSYQYNVLVYSNTSIIPGGHTFMLQNGQEGGGGNKSLTLFDYLIYSYDDGVEPENSASTPTISSSSPTVAASLSSGAGARQVNGISIGIIVGSICCFISIAVAVFVIYKRRKKTIIVPFCSTRQGNIDVVHNPMHVPSLSKSCIKEAAAAAPSMEVTELLEENDMLRRRLAEVTGSVAGAYLLRR
ncbi:hypothetical protein BDQ17DRAFT_1365873, partial [Cyathus striatus]